MGTWGTGVFDDDVAQDVQRLFEASLASGQSVASAARRIVDDPPWPLDDEEDAAVTYLALARLQLERGAVEPTIREKALAVIASGVPLWRWENAPPDQLREREKVLDELKVKLLGLTTGQ